MDYGVFLPVSGSAATRDGLRHAAQTAERLRFSTVWAADRIVIPWQIDTAYAYSWSGTFIVPPEKPFLDTMTALAFLAGATDRIGLGISVLVTTYRNTLHWAKVAATIDRLSEGRFICGVGIGWMREEFEALGLGERFEQRAALGEEQMAVAHNLFSESHASFHGAFHDYDDIAFEPKAHGARIPIWCGGESRGAQRRAGRQADAWFPYFTEITPQGLRERFEYVRETAAAAGRDPDSVRLNCCLPVEVTDAPIEQDPQRLRGTPQQIAHALAAFEAVGVEHVALQFLVGRFPERLAQMERLAPAIMPT
ncbi:MAG: TIGR03619 family F420-dependent LLM class oxidoreductase [Solirubrobacterales bacterium]|nr:TIGR03619 family F420-dependent LLM class oxidoreductase [Solirubrobacterales bacterium]